MAEGVENIAKQSDGPIEQAIKSVGAETDADAIFAGASVANNRDIEKIITDFELRKQFEEVTGIKLPSSKSDARKALKRYNQIAYDIVNSGKSAEVLEQES